MDGFDSAQWTNFFPCDSLINCCFGSLKRSGETFSNRQPSGYLVLCGCNSEDREYLLGTWHNLMIQLQQLSSEYILDVNDYAAMKLLALFEQHSQ